MVEIMVAFSILSLSFIAIMSSFPMSSMIDKAAENSTKASYLAQNKIEELYSLGYDNIATGTIETKHRLSNDESNYLYFFQRQTEAQNVDGNLNLSQTNTGLKKITVTVYYNDSLSKTEKSYTTTTLISQW